MVDQRLDGRGERVVWVMREDIARPKHRKQVRHLRGDSAQPRLRGWRPHLCLEVRTVELREHEHAPHVEQTVELIDVAGLQLQLSRQQLENLTRHPRVDLETNHTSVTTRSEEHTSELQSPCNLVCRLLLEKKK